MQTETKFVIATKELVDSLLAKNTNNRQINRNHVEQLKRDIMANKWFETGCIAVSSEDVLLDGQHRLIAIAECGYPPVRFNLMTNCNPNSVAVIDQQMKRTTSNICQMSNIQCSFALRISVRSIAKYLFGLKYPTQNEIIDIINLFQGKGKYILNVKNQRIITAGVITAFFIAEHIGFDVEMLTDAYAKLVRGEDLSKGNPILTLRNFLIKDTNVGGSKIAITYIATKNALICLRKNQKQLKVDLTKLEWM